MAIGLRVEDRIQKGKIVRPKSDTIWIVETYGWGNQYSTYTYNVW